MMSEIKAVGAIVRTMRLKREWSQADLAERAELSVSYLSDIERGRTIPAVGTLDKLAAAFDVEPGELLNVAHTLTAGEYQLLESWRSGDWSRLLDMVSAKMAEAKGE